ncbi:sodium transporter [Thalassotalea sp. HSM 43]|uniref:sodium:solute symporter family transporter n=1 Tax=Thalassotalea sp. HSM 43 TaxID=2552945 RepID=UPI001080FC49|nr:sodium/solute symporter [Thalassotalea sp. HSM 43]QBY04203.1 sodium transporter [Thalassotalea sp. HSM 43]
MNEFGILNWSILIVYIVANLLLGYVLSKKISSSSDFFLGNKTTPWWAIGISVIATYVSALTFLGAPAWAYQEGMGAIAIHLNYPLVIIAVVCLFFPFFYNAGVASIYEYQEKRFGKKARALVSTIWMLSQTMSSAAVLYATSLVLAFIINIDVTSAIFIVTIIALIYTMLGGITAVIWTDVIQSAILFVGAGIIMYALITNMPGDFQQTLMSLKDQGKLDPLNYSVDFFQTTTVWSGVIAMTIYHITVYGTNQMMVQRTLAAKNIGDAKKSYLLMGFLAFFIYLFFIVMGVLFYGYYDGREFENPNTIILTFAADYGMPGLMGIIAAAVMAASMSSLDSALNSLSTISTLDFYKKYFVKDKSDQHYLKATRIFTLVWALIIIIPAIMYHLHAAGSILEILTKVGSFFVGAQLGMFALGFFSQHTTERGLLIGTAAAFSVVTYVALATELAWPWYAVVGVSVSLVVSIIASLVLDGRQQTYSEYTIKGQIESFVKNDKPMKENGWYLVPGKIDSINYLLFAFFIVSIMSLVLFEYWIG